MTETRPARRKLDMELATTDDRIYAYFIGELDESKLSDKDNEIKKRILNIWTLLNNYHSPQQAVAAHLQHYEQSISLRTAWYDYRKATKLFGSVAESSQKASWILLKEYAMRTFQAATKRKDLKEMTGALKNLIEITKQLDDRAADTSMPSMYVLEMTFTGSGEKKSISLDKFEDIEDAEFAEIVEGVESRDLSDVDLRKIISKGDGEEGS